MTKHRHKQLELNYTNTDNKKGVGTDNKGKSGVAVPLSGLFSLILTSASRGKAAGTVVGIISPLASVSFLFNARC